MDEKTQIWVNNTPTNRIYWLKTPGDLVSVIALPRDLLGLGLGLGLSVSSGIFKLIEGAIIGTAKALGHGDLEIVEK